MCGGFTSYGMEMGCDFFGRDFIQVLGVWGLVNEIDWVMDVCLLWVKVFYFVGGGGRADNKEIVSAQFMAWR